MAGLSWAPRPLPAPPPLGGPLPRPRPGPSAVESPLMRASTLLATVPYGSCSVKLIPLTIQRPGPSESELISLVYLVHSQTLKYDAGTPAVFGTSFALGVALFFAFGFSASPAALLARDCGSSFSSSRRSKMLLVATPNDILLASWGGLPSASAMYETVHGPCHKVGGV